MSQYNPAKSPKTAHSGHKLAATLTMKNRYYLLLIPLLLRVSNSASALPQNSNCSKIMETWQLRYQSYRYARDRRVELIRYNNKARKLFELNNERERLLSDQLIGLQEKLHRFEKLSQKIYEYREARSSSRFALDRRYDCDDIEVDKGNGKVVRYKRKTLSGIGMCRTTHRLSRRNRYWRAWPRQSFPNMEYEFYLPERGDEQMKEFEDYQREHYQVMCGNKVVHPRAALKGINYLDTSSFDPMIRMNSRLEYDRYRLDIEILRPIKGDKFYLCDHPEYPIAKCREYNCKETTLVLHPRVNYLLFCEKRRSKSLNQFEYVVGPNQYDEWCLPMYLDPRRDSAVLSEEEFLQAYAPQNCLEQARQVDQLSRNQDNRVNGGDEKFSQSIDSRQR